MSLTAEERKAKNAANQRRYYQSNREKILQSQHAKRIDANVRRKQSRDTLREIINDIKAVPCQDCGVSYPPYVMDFDHVRGEKYRDVSTMIGGGFSLARVIAEIEKCDIVCSNCHRIRTHERRTNSETRSDSFECSPV